MRNYGVILSILILIASFISVPHVPALVTGASLSATQTGKTFTGDITVNYWGSGHDYAGTPKAGYYKVETEQWAPNAPPGEVSIDLHITYDSTGNVGGTIKGEINSTAAIRAEPGVLVGSWVKGAPRPFNGVGTLILSTTKRLFPKRNPALEGTDYHFQAGTFKWKAIGTVSAQRAYDLNVSTTTTSTTTTVSSGVSSGVSGGLPSANVSVGSSLSQTTGKTQGTDWDFGQSVTLNINASPPGATTQESVKGQWVVNKNISYVKVCISCGRKVQSKYEHYRTWHNNKVWICENGGYFHNGKFHDYNDTYEAVVFRDKPIKKIEWWIQKPGDPKSGYKYKTDRVNGGHTASLSYSLGSTPGAYRVFAYVYFVDRNWTFYWHSFIVRRSFTIN